MKEPKIRYKAQNVNRQSSARSTGHTQPPDDKTSKTSRKNKSVHTYMTTEARPAPANSTVEVIVAAYLSRRKKSLAKASNLGLLCVRLIVRLTAMICVK